ncbi:endoglucanase [Crossiella equi]|uniref:Glucanase n=2 Tax=Crossiella equi TaxID=130796 RepID=A0ABS5AR02_9PSEU|nr:glycoside hydrolase family 6 protein [Crossiella equi]MBP2478866.1 endoglucanase [Crossiella equi]
MSWTTRLTATLTLLLATATPAEAASPIDLTSGFYVNPNSTPATWVRDHPNDPRTPAIRTSIATRPIARWFTNDPNTASQVAAYTAAADTQDKLPVLVAYNLPGRDACGGHSGGGAGTAAAYRTWITTVAQAIATKPAVVILEPDALGDFDCMTTPQIQERLSLLDHATRMLKQYAPNTYTYLDGGNAGWVAAPTMASRLNQAGISNTRGFSVNVSNYYTTQQSATYANDVVSSLGRPTKFVIDTSRNANGGNGQWCNPPGRKLGTPAQVGGNGAELLLWVKTPGNSDGECGIAPTTPAGTFNPDLAIRLINGT